MAKLKYLIIFLVSISLIVSEIVWTRIFSAEFFYTFAFLVLSLAVLGLGLGALAARLFSFLKKKHSLGIVLTLTGASALLSPFLVFQLGLDFSVLLSDFNMILKLIAAIALLSSTFFFGGIALARLFSENHEDMAKLYMADMVGAGLGVVFATLLMNGIGTQLTVLYCGIPVLVAAFFASKKILKILPVLIIAGSFFASDYATDNLRVERKERAPIVYEHWDAFSKIKIFDYSPDYKGLNIDNIANSPLLRCDGDFNKPDSLKMQFGISVEYLINRFDSCRFLSLGAGGGSDVMQALQCGATEVHAAEVNGHINELMMNGEWAEYTGNVYNDSRVTVATEDARAYTRKFKNKFDVIFSLSSNSWAALSSGAFALAENYLFTTEAFEDYWESLSENGFLAMEHQFYMPRLVTEALTALENMGITNPKDHIAVYALPKMRRNLLLMSKQPLTDSLRYNAIFELRPEHFSYIHLLYPAADSLKDNLINRIVEHGWENVADSAKIDISPVSDDRPFIAQMGLMKNVDFDNISKILPYEFMGFPLSKIIITIILAIVVILIIPLNFIPYFKKGDKLKASPWLYFFSIGAGFMMIEVVLIQKYTLFIGPSVYSILTILMTLLLSSGIGSRMSKRFSNRFAFGGIIIWILFDVFLMTLLTNSLGGMPMALRIITSIILIAPLGFFMGMPFPKGALRVGKLTDWGFAVNGAASVLGSGLVILIAFSFGISTALLCGGLVYLSAWGLYKCKW